MKKSIYIIIPTLALVLLLFAGCEKKEDMIINEWDYVHLDTKTDSIRWVFSSDNTLIIHYLSKGDSDTASYSFSDKELVLKDCKIQNGYPDYGGYYYIESLNKDKFIIRRTMFLNESDTAAFLWLEFKIH